MMEQYASPHSEQNDHDAGGNGESDHAGQGPPQFLDPTLDFGLAESEFSFRQSTATTTNAIISSSCGVVMPGT
jgi:hypothetical protein